MLKVLYVYRFATFGGVERVLLSRAEAFKQYGVHVRIFLYFFEDLGARHAIKEYIDTAELSEYVTLVKDIRAHEYDYVISIDTPEILKYKIDNSKLLFECHTTYARDRVYLSRLPGNIRLVVPSAAMKKDLEQEQPQLNGKIVVLRNYVAVDQADHDSAGIFWQKRPLLYLGRMDEHKNIREALDVFESYRRHHGDDLMLILAGMVTESIDLHAELRQRHLLDRTVVFPPIRFDRVQQIYSLVKKHKGIFISSSHGESFGLSVAEAMANGLPVLLSGIGAHADLVQGNMDFLYPLGDPVAGAVKLEHIVCNYHEMQMKIEGLKGQFSMATFIEDWQRFTTLLPVG
jgi:glycosyltransferase involved in cell wall biosynthesis